MKKTTIWVILSICLLVIIGGILFFKAKTVEAPLENVQNSDNQVFEKTLDVKYQFKDGTHVFMGEVESPTPCHQVSAQIFPGEIAELNIEIKDSGNICAQVVTNIPYKVSFSAPENQKFSAKLNGQPVNLNLFKVDPDLDINSVEIFIKG